MSWPKAFVMYKGKLRTATVWGLYARGSGAIVDGKPVDMAELAVSIYCPDGITEYPDPRWKSFVIPITDVKSINWECLGFFEGQVTAQWWQDHGVKCHVNGYGAEEKQADLDAKLKGAP